MTFVQIVIFIVAVAVYGIAPIGSSETEYSEAVGVTDLQIKMGFKDKSYSYFCEKNIL